MSGCSIESVGFGSIVRVLGDLVFPPVCVHCGGLVEDSGFRHLCRGCAGGLVYSSAGPAAVLLEGPARSFVHELKYRAGRYLAGDAESIFRRSGFMAEFARGAAIVPVPLHSRKERERGYNQSAILARALARAAGGGTRVVPVLRRVVDTPSQTGLDREDRIRNVKNAFALRPSAGLNPRLRYLLFDDVFTTGSTLEGCARVLRRAGCLNLDLAAFGHG